MSNENPNLDVTATLDASGLLAEAAQSAAAIKAVAETTEKSADSAQKATEATEANEAAIKSQTDALKDNAQARKDANSVPVQAPEVISPGSTPAATVAPAHTEAVKAEAAAEDQLATSLAGATTAQNAATQATIDATAAAAQAAQKAQDAAAAQARAAAAAAQWGVSTEVAAAALKRIDAETFSAQVNAVAANMRKAAAATNAQATALNSTASTAPAAAAGLQLVAGAAHDAGNASDATKEQHEALTHALQKQREATMRTVFQFHRLMEGFKDLSMGGRMATQGMVDIEESVQSFLPPAAQMVLAIGSAVGMLTMLAMSHKKGHGEALEHAKAEQEAAKKVTDAWKESNEELESELKEIDGRKFWTHQADEAKKLTDEIKLQVDAVKLIADAQEHLRRATQELQVAELNRQEALDLAGKTGQDEAAIKARYSSLRSEAMATNEVERKGIELRRAEEERLALQREATAKASILDAHAKDRDLVAAKVEKVERSMVHDPTDYERARDLQADLERRQRNVGRAVPGLSEETETAAGHVLKPVAPLTPVQAIQLQTLQGPEGLTEQYRQRANQRGTRVYDESVKQQQAEKEYLQKEEATELKGAKPEEQPEITERYKKQIDAIDAFLLRVETYNNLVKQREEGQAIERKELAENKTVQVETNSKLAALDITIQALQKELATAGVKGETVKKTEENEAQARSINLEKQIRDNELATQITQLETRLKGVNSEPAQRTLNAQISRLRARQTENKTKDELAGMTSGTPKPEPVADPVEVTQVAFRKSIQAQADALDVQIKNNGGKDPTLDAILERRREALYAQLNFGAGSHADDVQVNAASRPKAPPERNLVGELAQSVRAKATAEEKDEVTQPKAKDNGETKHELDAAIKLAMERLKEKAPKEVHGALEHISKTADGAGKAYELIRELTIAMGTEVDRETMAIIERLRHAVDAREKAKAPITPVVVTPLDTPKTTAQGQTTQPAPISAPKVAPVAPVINFPPERPVVPAPAPEIKVPAPVLAPAPAIPPLVVPAPVVKAAEPVPPVIVPAKPVTAPAATSSLIPAKSEAPPEPSKPLLPAVPASEPPKSEPLAQPIAPAIPQPAPNAPVPEEKKDDGLLDAVKSANDSASASVAAHPELAQGIKALADSTGQQAKLITDLATSTSLALASVQSELKKAQDAIFSLKNNHQS